MKDLSIIEAAQYFNLRKSNFFKLTSSREIPHYKLGKQIFFTDKNWIDG